MLMFISYGRSFLVSIIRVNHKVKSTYSATASALHSTTASTTGTIIESVGELLFFYDRIEASIIKFYHLKHNDGADDDDDVLSSLYIVTT